jgi:hypothetical protein
MSAIPDIAGMMQWTLRAAVALLMLAAAPCVESVQVDAGDAPPGMGEVHLQLPEAPLRMTTP